MCFITSKVEDYSGFGHNNVRRKTDAAIPAVAVTGKGRPEAETRVKERALVIPPPTGVPCYYNHIIGGCHHKIIKP